MNSGARNENYDINEHFAKMEEDVNKNGNIVKEDEMISLRKNRARKQNDTIFNLFGVKKTEEFNIDEVQATIENEKLFIDFNNNSNNEFYKLDLLMQMITTQNENFVKYGLYQIQMYLSAINNENYIKKNLNNKFNEKMISYLYELITKYYVDNLHIISFCSTIITKIYEDYDPNSILIIGTYLTDILNIASNTNNYKIKNELYELINIIFRGNEKITNNLTNLNVSFFNHILKEVLIIQKKLSTINSNMNMNELLEYKNLLPTLFSSVLSFLYYKMYLSEFLKPINEIKELDFNINIPVIVFLIKYTNDLLKLSYEKELFRRNLYLLRNIVEFTMFNSEHLNNIYLNNNTMYKIIRKALKEISTSQLIKLIYDQSIDEPEIRIPAIQTIINLTFIFPKSKYIIKLINEQIAEQIENLQKYLLSDEINLKKNDEQIYKFHLILIKSLISCESEKVVSELTTMTDCIENLYDFIGDNKFNGKYKDLILEIFHVLIKSPLNFVKVFLLSMKVVEVYNSVLKEESTKAEIIKIILEDLLTLLQFETEKLTIKSGKKPILLHLQKIGLYETIINLKNRNDLSNDIIEIINKILNE